MTTITAPEATDLFRAPPERWVDVGNGEVAHRRVGTGPDVLFVHGWPVSGATFRGLLPHLAPHVTCHVVDLVGAGDSRFDRSATLGIAEHVDAVRRVVDALGLTDVAVVGHDSGGLIGRHALAGDPRVRGWGLVDTEQPQGLNWRAMALVRSGVVPGVEHVLATLFARRRLRRSSLLLGGCFEDSSLLDGEFEEFFLAPLARDPDRRWAAGELMRRFDVGAVAQLADLHARMTAPVQLVWGARDPFFPVAAAADMVRGFGGPASLHVVDRGRLFVHEEFPAETAEALLPTLRG